MINQLHFSFWAKIILTVLLVLCIFGFFYFETSILLRIIVILFGGFSLIWAFSQKNDQIPLVSRREILVLLIIYLGLYTLYNLLYGLGIPLYMVMIAVWVLVGLLFFGLLVLDRIDSIISRPLFWVFISLVGLVILEVFLSLAFWPVDPKFKTLILVVIFYLITNLIYLYSNNVLKLKRVTGFLIAGLVIITLAILNIWFSLKGG